MYVKRNTGARSCNHCCSGKSISITYSECMFVNLCTQHVLFMRNIVICGMAGSTNDMIFGGKKLLSIKYVF